ncbi:RNA-binding KH domain-containing protein [Drosera capensis]
MAPPPPPSAVDSQSASPAAAAEASEKWPGWPGDCVFRLIVPVTKVGSIIGRKGELIKKMCDESRAKIRVLDGPVANHPDRDCLVLISGKEELEAPLSPAMDAVIRVFRRINGLPDNTAEDKTAGVSGVAYCSSRLLVHSTQATSLIGKQGALIKSIQESSGASVRVLSGDEVPSYVSADERIVEVLGEALKVLQALELVIGHLRKFLVDHGVLPLYENTYTSAVSQGRQVEHLPDRLNVHSASQTGFETDYPLSVRSDPYSFERELMLGARRSASGFQTYGLDSGLPSSRSSLGLGHPTLVLLSLLSFHAFLIPDSMLVEHSLLYANGFVSRCHHRLSYSMLQVTQTMQIALTYAEDIIGAGGQNIAYIRCTSGAVLTVKESRVPDEIMVEIKGTSAQVQVAQELIQESISNHKEPLTSSYGKLDTALPPSYSQFAGSYPSSQPYDVYGSSGFGGYSSFR